MLVLLLIALFLFPNSSNKVTQFKEVAPSFVPESLGLCADPDAEQRETCLLSFQETGEARVGDVNGDGQSEWLIQLGARDAGSGGEWFHLFAKRSGKWVELYNRGWQTLVPRFDILPTVRHGYHDLRVDVELCLKWNGTKYVDYSNDDYRKLRAGWFDRNSPYEAELFWRIRYGGRKEFTFEPIWTQFFESRELGSFIEVEDRVKGLRWIALFKGGVWGVRGNRAFLLLPQPTYKGSEKLEIKGEWLVIHGELEDPGKDPPIVARYNRRTHVLLIGAEK